MSVVKVQGNASGTGIFTIAAPATNTDRTLTLPDLDGTLALTSQTSSFASGTAMMFVQTAAPTGWTKSTTHNDKALRVVSGSASSGGSSAFSTVFTNQTPTITTSGLSAAATTLSTTQMPSHRHGGLDAVSNSGGNRSINTSAGCGSGLFTQYTDYQGGGGSHTHSLTGSATSSAITLAVQYVDVIIATKD
jgi:hypothetical protein